MNNSLFNYVVATSRASLLTLGVCALIIGTFGTGVALANNPTPGVCSHGVCSRGCTIAPGPSCTTGPVCNGAAWCNIECDKGCALTYLATTCECQGTF